MKASHPAGRPASHIVVHDLHKIYRRGSETIDVLRGLHLSIPQGDFVAFMGPSGSGKTTLLNLIGGIDKPTSGTIQIGAERIDNLTASELTRWRSTHVGFIFQMFNLIPVLTAFENVEMPLLLTRMSRSQRRKHVETALSLVGLGDRMKHYPRQLSGGQEQRVAIARAIVTDPALLLCDEPTGDLDRDSANEIMELLQKLSTQQRKTVLMVTHDPLAAARAHRVLHMDKGVLVEPGSSLANQPS
jgi:putative ABC transport system ATP-binding protein